MIILSMWEESPVYLRILYPPCGRGLPLPPPYTSLKQNLKTGEVGEIWPQIARMGGLTDDAADYGGRGAAGLASAEPSVTKALRR